MAVRTISNAGGNWNATGTWVEGVVPVAADDVVATNTSGPLNVTATAACRSLDFTNGGAANYPGNFHINDGITLSIGTSSVKSGAVALKMSAAMTTSYGGVMTNVFIAFVSTSGTLTTITTAGQVMPYLTFTGTGGSWRFEDNVAYGSGGLQQSRGTLNLNGKTFDVITFNSNFTTARTLTMGAAVVTVRGDSANFTVNGTALTMTANTALFKMSGDTPTLTLNASWNTNGASFEYTGTGELLLTSASNWTWTLKDFTRVGGGIQIAVRFSIVCTGTLTLTASSLDRMRFATKDWALAGGRGLTAATVNLANVSFNNINAAGAAAPFTGTNLGNHGDNTGITFPAPRNLYWVGGTGSSNDSAHWALTSGGAGGNAILPQDTGIFDANSFTADGQVFTVYYIFDNPAFDFSAVNRPVTVDWAPLFVVLNGDLRWSPFCTPAQGYSLWLHSVNSDITGGVATVYCNGGDLGTCALATPVLAGAFSLFLGDDYKSSGGQLSLISKGFNSMNYDIDVPKILATGTAVHSILLGTSTITLRGTTGQLWDSSNGQANLTLDADEATFIIADPGGITKHITVWGQKTFGKIVLPPTHGGIFTLWGGFTIPNIELTTPKQIDFQTGQTFKFGPVPFTINHNGAELLNLRKTSAGVFPILQFETPQAPWGETYLSIGDVDHAPANGQWTAGYGSVDAGDSSGWVFDPLFGEPGPEDLVPPVVTLGDPSRQKISRVAGMDATVIPFTVDEDFDAYEVRVGQPGSSRTASTLLESGPGGTADTEYQVTITDDELVAAGGAEGNNSIMVFAQDSAGNWSEIQLLLPSPTLYPSPNLYPAA